MRLLETGSNELNSMCFLFLSVQRRTENAGEPLQNQEDQGEQTGI